MVLLRSGKNTNNTTNNTTNTTNKKTYMTCRSNMNNKAFNYDLYSSMFNFIKKKTIFYPFDDKLTETKNRTIKNAIKGYLYYNNIRNPECDIQSVFNSFKKLYYTSIKISGWNQYYTQNKSIIDKNYSELNQYLENIFIENQEKFVFFDKNVN